MSAHASSIAPPAASYKTTALINVFLFAIVITANCLSILLPLNGKTQAELSAQYPNLFTPAGFTFSIWSVIYTLLIGFVVYQMYVLWVARHHDKRRILSISPLFAGVCLCNAGWLFAWHWGYTTLSVIIMLFHLYFLVLIHYRLSLAIAWSPLPSKLWLDIPFSLYLGWICVATIANVTAWLVAQGITLSFVPPQVWTIGLLAVALLIGIFYVFTCNNKFLALSIAWAFYGIISQRRESGDPASHTIVIAAWLGFGILLLIVVMNSLRRRVPDERPAMSA